MTHVECEHCGYEWEYGGELEFATCPSCRTKTAATEDEQPAD
jgi:predicted Zn-ribbon and HTH transcriptional regulator